MLWGAARTCTVYDGASFARNGVVCIAMNYRVGIEGFLPIAGVPTNLGLRDMIAALQWVRDNVSAFGGDPANVTLFGESGGAFCIAALMTSPLASGLFRRAICQSGHVYVSRDLALMQRLMRRVAKRLRVTPDRAGFTSKPAEALLPAQDWAMRPSLFCRTTATPSGAIRASGITRFLPVQHDDVLPRPGHSGAGRRARREVDLLIGTNTDEGNLFFAPGGGEEDQPVGGDLFPGARPAAARGLRLWPGCAGRPRRQVLSRA